MIPSTVKRQKPMEFLALAFFMQIMLFFVIIFPVPVARQVIGFIYLTFVPGFAILHLFGLKLEKAEATLFAVGLSITFLMGEGFLLNMICPLIGLSTPLTLVPLTIATTVSVDLFLFLGWHNYEPNSFSVDYKKMVTIGIVLGAILILCIFGTLLVNVPSKTNNSVLLLMIVSIALLIGLIAFSRKIVSVELYPLILFVVTLTLLFHLSLFSNYIHGGDIFGEYSFFKFTMSNSYWNPNVSNRMYAMLSITILPTIYSIIMGLEGTWILKIVYPLILAFVPLGLYQLFRFKVNREFAFFSVFFFISNTVFFNEIAELARQMIGELFYILLFLTLFNNNIKGSAKWLLFTVFSFGLVVSHYAMAYIFLAFIFASWLISHLRRHKSVISASMVVLFVVLTFSWYIYISSASTFNDLEHMVNDISGNFVSDFLNPQSRGSQVLEGVGASGLNTLWHIVGRYIYYITEALIILGFLGSLLKKLFSFFDDEYNILVFLNVGIVAACIIVPNLANTFNMTRFYQVSLFFLAPFCVIGGMDVLSLLSRKKVKEKYLSLIIVLFVLIPYFFFQTGFIYEVTGEESWSLPLSAHRFDAIKLFSMGVVGEFDVFGVNWLSKYQSQVSVVYADLTSGGLLDYGNIKFFTLIPFTQSITSGSYIFLRSIITSNVSQLSPSLDTTNHIYSNGLSEIYKVPK